MSGSLQRFLDTPGSGLVFRVYPRHQKLMNPKPSNCASRKYEISEPRNQSLKLSTPNPTSYLEGPLHLTSEIHFQCYRYLSMI